MTPRLRRATIAIALAGGFVPRAAAACATCLSSAYGDRTFSWAYGGLLLAPFGLAVVVVAILGWSAGYRPAHARLIVSRSLRRWRLRHGLAAPLAAGPPGLPASHDAHPHEETT